MLNSVSPSFKYKKAHYLASLLRYMLNLICPTEAAGRDMLFGYRASGSLGCDLSVLSYVISVLLCI